MRGTFYPGATDVSTARKITVGISQTLERSQHRSSAYAPCDDQRRLSWMLRTTVQWWFVKQMPRGGITFGGAGGGPVRPDGTFDDRERRSGTVQCERARRGLPVPGRRRAPPDFSVAAVAVNGEDVTDVRPTPVLQSRSAAAFHLTMPVPRSH
jgi:hypothetical protein